MDEYDEAAVRIVCPACRQQVRFRVGFVAGGTGRPVVDAALIHRGIRVHLIGCLGPGPRATAPA